ncbi:unnamed protein product [Acanthoscelides obtectus]|uniref:Uncharacterized protein n=1 Tax=Acanthoscelides obtectus TaxID=200917 RepID=A0A9P0KFN4_ACAOB|nr:unnamed protein product [Acanthoscelides obtectus]CAK1667530.1 hypothetical protein AOBTE_LOCUS25893 [Acanthoscelides obtectus]
MEQNGTSNRHVSPFWPMGQSLFAVVSSINCTAIVNFSCRKSGLDCSRCSLEAFATLLKFFCLSYICVLVLSPNCAVN